MKQIPLGTISHGTMRTDDLIEAFEDFLEVYAPEKLKELHCDWWETERTQTFKNEYLLEGLWPVMKEIAPDGCYFGATEGDGSDYGYWLEPDEI